jgi:hypothetical protein
MKLVRPALALLAALSVLVSFVLGGHRYFYCAQMHEVGLDACCPQPHSELAARGPGTAGDEGPSIARSACCTAEQFAPAAPAVHPASDGVPCAPVSAVLPAQTPASRAPRPTANGLAYQARAGPIAPDPREQRLRLMVWLT